MMTGLSIRMGIARAFFSRGRGFPTSPLDAVGGMLRPPCTKVAPRYISAIQDDGEYSRVRFHSTDASLCWPRSLPLFDLYKVVTESFDSSHWHYYEVPETQVLEGDVVLDCGAAEGMFSVRVLERAARIAAFEPLPLFVASLRQTFADNPKVTVVPAALGSEEGEAFLDGSSLYGIVSDNRQGVPIQVTTIDKWVEDNGIRVNYIKGDLESFEMEVLKGAVETIGRDRPRIALTVYHPGNNWMEMLAFVRKLAPKYQYRVKGISYNGNVPRPVMLHLWHD